MVGVVGVGRQRRWASVCRCDLRLLSWCCPARRRRRREAEGEGASRGLRVCVGGRRQIGAPRHLRHTRHTGRTTTRQPAWREGRARPTDRRAGDGQTDGRAGAEGRATRREPERGQYQLPFWVLETIQGRKGREIPKRSQSQSQPVGHESRFTTRYRQPLPHRTASAAQPWGLPRHRRGSGQPSPCLDGRASDVGPTTTTATPTTTHERNAPQRRQLTSSAVSRRLAAVKPSTPRHSFLPFIHPHASVYSAPLHHPNIQLPGLGVRLTRPSPTLLPAPSPFAPSHQPSPAVRDERHWPWQCQWHTPFVAASLCSLRTRP